MRIHPTALIDPSAEIASDVVIGPFSIVGADVVIGAGTIVESHVVIKGPTTIGKANHIYQFSTIGEDTPDLKYKGEPTTLTIGDNNVIREGVTIHRGTIQDRSDTYIGNHNLIMAYVHIGHDSVIGDHCILVNNTALAGHVVIGSWAFLGGYTLVHQYCHIGAHSFTGMGTAIGKDIPAFVMVAGSPAAARSINVEGLRRRGFHKAEIARLVSAYKIVYRRGNTIEQAISVLSEQAKACPHTQMFIKSLQASTRGILR